MEVLAPCGDDASFNAAINNGADAIYLGLGDFNARAKATYFNLDNIRDYIECAHLFGVKVYITTNTLLFDNEIPAFIEFAKKIISYKPDAFIVQDLVVAKILRELGAEIHASTQLGIHNVAGARIAKELGFSRVVLSRETKLADIAAIKQATGLEIEYFVQGALCVSFSGNCYLSALEHDKSGNRGQCLQLCRLPYTAYLDEKNIGEGFLLSARDLCLIENLAELKNAGVDSLKIEGRLRRAAYVAQSVKSYRRAVDAISFPPSLNLNINTNENNKINKNNDTAYQNTKAQNTVLCNEKILKNDKKTLNLHKNHGKIDFKDEIHNLKKVFSRGEFNTRAYLDAGTPDNIINPEIQNHLGEKIGVVENVEPFKDLFRITIKSEAEIHSGDGLKFLDTNNKECASAGVGNVEKLGNNLYRIYSKSRAQKGYNVYRTLDKINEDNLINFVKKLEISGAVFAHINEPLKIEFSYTKNNEKITAEIVSNFIIEEAKNAPTTPEEIHAQINKLNDTDFVLTNLKINAEKVFLPKSVLNQTRRDCVALLREKIINKYEQKLIEKQQNSLKTMHNTDTMQQILSTMHTNFASKYENMYIIDEDCINNLIAISQQTVVSKEAKFNSNNSISNNTEKTNNFNYVQNTFTLTNKDLIIISPQKYTLENVEKLINNLDNIFKNKTENNQINSAKNIQKNSIKETNKLTNANLTFSPAVALELPIISNEKDFKILSEIIEKIPVNIPLVINNLSGLIFANSGHEIIAGLGMNVHNIFDAEILRSLGVNEIILSKEINEICNNFYQFAYGKHSLMTFAHCPFKTLFKNTCANCKYSKNLKLKSNDGHGYDIRRTILSQCYFTLNSNKMFKKIKKSKNLIDLRI